MKYLISILLVLVILSCTSRTIYKKPDDLISKNKMIELWTDIYIASSASSIKNKKTLQKVNYLPIIKDKYQIDSTRFMRSNVYYTSRVEDYEKMFKQVEINLRKIRDQYDPEMAGIDPNLPIYKRDSIRRARIKQKDANIRPVESSIKEKLEKKSTPQIN